MWFFLALISAVLYAWMWLLARMSRGIASSTTTAAVTAWGVPLFLWMLTQVTYPWSEIWWRLYLVLPLAVIPWTMYLLTYASQRAPVTVVKPLAAISTLSTLVVSAIFFRNIFLPAHVMGIFVVTTGLFYLYRGNWQAWREPWPWYTLLGVLVLGVNVAAIKEVLLRFPHPFAVLALAATGTFVWNAAFSCMQRNRTRITVPMMRLLLIFALVTIVQDFTTFMAIAAGPAPHVIAVKRTSILFAAIFSYTFLHERQQSLWKLLLASGIVVMGVVMLVS